MAAVTGRICVRGTARTQATRARPISSPRARPRAPRVQPVIGMRVDDTGWPWRFRHKASFVFGDGADGRAPTIGHYARRLAPRRPDRRMSGARRSRQPARVCAARASGPRARPRPARRCAACCVISSSARRATIAKRSRCSSSRATTSRCARRSGPFSPPKRPRTASI